VFSVYVVEVNLKQNPFPLSVERKKLHDAKSVFKRIMVLMEKGNPQLIELNCEKLEDKSIAFLGSEVQSVQIYEKTGAIGGMKRPGFSFDG